MGEIGGFHPFPRADILRSEIQHMVIGKKLLQRNKFYPRSRMARPILAVDVDGVVALFGFEAHPDRSQTKVEVVDGIAHCISLSAGPRLLELGEHYDLVWASGWEDRANMHLLEPLGLPEIPFLKFGRDARFGTADWKLEPLEKFAAGRPLAWIDDSFDERCYEWARAREESTLLIPSESHVGLSDIHVEALIAWARGV